MSNVFEGKSAVVTGAARGIGEATARLLHQRGARVVIADIDVDEGERVAASLGDRASFVRLDVTSEAEWEALGDQFTDRSLDLLVHSAGAASKSPIADTTLDEFQRMLDLNLVSTFLAIRTASRRMSDGGAIVTLSSLRGVLATAGLGSYGASKFGVRALSRVASLELADRNIRVNAVCPGSVETPITSGPGFENDDVESYVQSIPLRRRATPDEVARTIAFLLSDDAGYVTGTDFIIDGGQAAGRRTPTKTTS